MLDLAALLCLATGLSLIVVEAAADRRRRTGPGLAEQVMGAALALLRDALREERTWGWALMLVAVVLLLVPRLAGAEM